MKNKKYFFGREGGVKGWGYGCRGERGRMQEGGEEGGGRGRGGGLGLVGWRVGTVRGCGGWWW